MRSAIISPQKAVYQVFAWPHGFDENQAFAGYSRQLGNQAGYLEVLEVMCQTHADAPVCGAVLQVDVEC